MFPLPWAAVLPMQSKPSTNVTSLFSDDFSTASTTAASSTASTGKAGDPSKVNDLFKSDMVGAGSGVRARNAMFRGASDDAGEDSPAPTEGAAWF